MKMRNIRNTLTATTTAIAGVILAISTNPVFADSLDELGKKADTATSEITQTVGSAAWGVFGISALVSLITLGLAKNDKKISGAIYALGFVAVAALGVALVTSGTFKTIIEALANLIQF